MQAGAAGTRTAAAAELQPNNAVQHSAASAAHLVRGLLHGGGARGQRRRRIARHARRVELKGLVGLVELEGAGGPDLDRGSLEGAAAVVGAGPAAAAGGAEALRAGRHIQEELGRHG